MESIRALKPTEREQQLYNWLSGCQLSIQSITPLAGDASFRRYYRLTTSSGSYIVMDAPPPIENCRPFVAVATALRSMGLQVPDVIAADLENGFLILTDFGDATFQKALTEANADKLYKSALSALALLQSCKQVPEHTLPLFDIAFMQKEWAWHKEWFLEKFLAIHLSSEVEQELDNCYDLLVQSAAEQPQVFMYRDFQSANLMVLPNDQVGLLDFQDAFIGPITYDLASLLRDCYIDWSNEQVYTWVNYYRELLVAQHTSVCNEATFRRWFDLMGLQRHLKCLLTFARKQVRDEQPHYLQFIPRTLKYIREVSANYPELKALHIFYTEHIKDEVICAR